MGCPAEKTVVVREKGKGGERLASTDSTCGSISFQKKIRVSPNQVILIERSGHASRLAREEENTKKTSDPRETAGSIEQDISNKELGEEIERSDSPSLLGGRGISRAK